MQERAVVSVPATPAEGAPALPPPPPPAEEPTAQSPPQTPSRAPRVGERTFVLLEPPSIEGRIFARGVTPSGTEPNTKDVPCCGPTIDSRDLVLSGDNGLVDAVVYLKNAKAPDGWERTDRQIEQRGCRFEPRVTILPAGRTVVFVNADPVLHNVRWMSMNNGAANFGVASGKSYSVKLEQPDFISFDCAIHPHMACTIVVAAHPWFVVTDDQGRYRLDGVPDGSYVLMVQHSKLGKLSKKGTEVLVRHGKTVKLDLEYR